MIPLLNLLVVVFSVTTTAGLSWEKFNLYPGRVLPRFANLLTGSSFQAYCGSDGEIVNWKYTDFITNDLQSVSKKHFIGYKSIILKDLVQNDSGIYACEGHIYNADFVNGLPVNIWHEVHKGHVVPSWKEVSKGNSVQLTCGSLSPVIWFSVHYTTQNKTAEDNVLTLHDLQRKHSGPYACRGTKRNEFNKLIIFHATSVVVVDGTINRVMYPIN